MVRVWSDLSIIGLKLYFLKAKKLICQDYELKSLAPTYM